MRVNQPVTQRERLYPSHQNLISTTDLESRITYANDEFCQIAGFTLEELQGAPHNLVRHPDMPPQAFADMWRHLREGKSWMGPVKNRCKNGDHYWVNAFVTPIQDASGKVVEYQSVRTAPDDAIKQRAERVYDEMRRGKTPRALRLPPCCHTLGIHLCLMALLASLVTLGYQHGPGWPLLIGALPLVVALVIRQTLSRRLARLETLARHRFDNPLMQLLYTGRVDRLAAVELAMKMNQAEFNAVLARTQQTCQQIVQAAQTDLNNAESITGNLQQQQAQTNQVATAIKTQSSTGEIQQMISLLQASADDAQQAMAQGEQLSASCRLKAAATGDILQQISERLLQVTAGSNQIAQAVQEQSLVTQDIHHSVLDIKRLADDSSQGSRHAVQGIIALVKQLGDLERLVRQFQQHPATRPTSTALTSGQPLLAR